MQTGKYQVIHLNIINLQAINMTYMISLTSFTFRIITAVTARNQTENIEI